jgi:predicted pyridoxine 5'-phosphate oxidase superfamily flavin-nucleotide-binding protein
VSGTTNLADSNITGFGTSRAKALSGPKRDDDIASTNRDAARSESFANWHPGEVALQQTAGSDAVLARHAPRILLPYMIDQLRAFFPLLPFVVVSFVDDEECPWGTIIPGAPGFASSPTPQTLRIERLPPAGDPFAAALRAGTSVGVLGIELYTRRRNRVNGVVSACDGTGFTVTVQQAYGNCPKYIQQRDYTGMNALPGRVEASTFTYLDAEARSLLNRADTMFVASFAPGPDGSSAMDISHRGGRPGFVRIDEDGSLTIPDFSGNRYFNTLGNILVTGRAGLLVPCFETGDILLLTGGAEIGLDDNAKAQAAKVAAERIWRMRPRRGIWMRRAMPVEFQLKSWSLHTLGTDVWPKSARSHAEEGR